MMNFPAEIPPRRTRRLLLHIDMFLTMLRGLDGLRRIRCQGIPDDAVCVGFSWDEIHNVVTLLLESDDFDEVSSGAPSPFLTPTFDQFFGDAVPSA